MNNNKLWMFALCVLAPATALAGPLVDPTRPYGAPSGQHDAAPRGPVLQSIMVSTANRSALISGRRVRIGDSYDGAVITDITPYEVRMTKSGREITLRLHPKLNKDQGVTP